MLFHSDLGQSSLQIGDRRDGKFVWTKPPFLVLGWLYQIGCKNNGVEKIGVFLFRQIEVHREAVLAAVVDPWLSEA